MILKKKFVEYKYLYYLCTEISIKSASMHTNRAYVMPRW